MRRSFFQSTILFWLLFPAAFVPLALHSSVAPLWCGFGLGRPWHYGYYCEDRGIRIDSLVAFFGDFIVGFAAVLVFWLVVRHLFGVKRI